MKILVFTEGTIIYHKNAVGKKRDEVVEQVIDNERSVDDFATYVPIGKAAEKIRTWQASGAEICYLTSRKKEGVNIIKNLLDEYHFPKGELYFRKEGEEYKDVAERVMPDILIEDDCESIGGEPEMTYTFIKPELKKKIKLIVVKEFNGIDHLSSNPNNL